MKKRQIFNITLSGLLLGLGIVLPFITGMSLGSILSPMHIPIILCGFICGYKYGLLVGIICPLLRCVLFGMPQFYPTAISMSVELGLYGLSSGLLYKKFKNCKLPFIAIIYITLVSSQIIGRLGWGLVRFILGTIDKSNVFTFKTFIEGAFIIAWPGIVIQLIIIPILVVSLKNYID